MITDEQLTALFEDEEFKKAMGVAFDNSEKLEKFKKKIKDESYSYLTKSSLELLFGEWSPLVSHMDSIKEIMKNESGVALKIATNSAISEQQFNQYLQDVKKNYNDDVIKSLRNIRQITLNQNTTIEKEWTLDNGRTVTEPVQKNAVENLVASTVQDGKLNEDQKKSAANLVKDYVEACAEQMLQPLSEADKASAEEKIHALEQPAVGVTRPSVTSEAIPASQVVGESTSQPSFFDPRPIQQSPRLCFVELLRELEQLANLVSLQQSLDNIFAVLNFVHPGFAKPISRQPNHFYLQTSNPFEMIEDAFDSWISSKLNLKQASLHRPPEGNIISCSFTSLTSVMSFGEHLSKTRIEVEVMQIQVVNAKFSQDLDSFIANNSLSV